MDVWVARNLTYFKEYVCIYLEKPRLHKGKFGGRVLSATICHSEFAKVTGHTITPGQCLKVRFTMEVLK